MKRVKPHAAFALCIRSDDSDDLEQQKIYQLLPDRTASREGYVRVVDESGEDYLYPAEYFVPVRLPAVVVQKLELLSGPAVRPSAAVRDRPAKMRLRAGRG